MSLDFIGDLPDLHSKSDVGFVGAVVSHGICITDAGKLLFKLHFKHTLEEMFHQILESVEHVLTFHK